MVMARTSVGQQLVAWMLPVRQWRAMLPAALLPPAVRTARAPGPLSFAEKMALARLLEEVPVVQDPDTRKLVVQSLPNPIRRSVRLFGPLGLDMFGLIRTGLEYDGGIASLYRVLLAMEGPGSKPLQAFHDLAEHLDLLTGTEDNP
nr:hypothetical protein [Micromonospora phytophila]